MLKRSDRKKQLIAEGAVYRAEVMIARQAVQSSLRPDSLARNALHHAVLVGMSALKGRNIGGLPGMNLQSLLPIAMSGVAALSRNKALARVVLRGAVIAGSVAGIVRMFSRKKKSDAATEASGEPSGY